MKAAALVLVLLLAGCASIDQANAPAVFPVAKVATPVKVKPAPAATAANPTANEQVHKRWRWPTFFRKQSTTN